MCCTARFQLEAFRPRDYSGRNHTKGAVQQPAGHRPAGDGEVMATKIWAATGVTVSDNWSVALRWNPSAPVANDQIIIGNITQTGAFTVTEDVTLAITSLAMAGNHKSSQTSTLLVSQPAVLTVNGPISLVAD